MSYDNGTESTSMTNHGGIDLLVDGVDLATGHERQDTRVVADISDKLVDERDEARDTGIARIGYPQLRQLRLQLSQLGCDAVHVSVN